MDERLFKIMKKRLKYDDNDFALFSERAANREVLGRIKEISQTRIIAEIISARGCNSQHEAGQKFFFDGAGNLLSETLPRKTCIFLLANLQPAFIAIHELIYAGINPEDIKLRFPRVGCLDVGVENCGWGKVISEVSVQKI
jgi:hypothetical protein